MPHGLTDTSNFDAPIQAVSDGDLVNAAITDQAPQGLANRTRFLLDKGLQGNTTWPLTSQIIKVPLLSGQVDGGNYVAQWAPLVSGATPRYSWAGQASGGRVYFPLEPIIRGGNTITAIDAIIATGNVRSGTNRTNIAIGKIVHNFALPTSEPTTATMIGSVQYDDGVTAAGTNQRILLSGLTEVVDRTAEYFIRVSAGTDGSYAQDFLRALQIWLAIPSVSPGSV